MTAAGVAVLDEFNRLNLVKNSATTGAYLQARLREKLLPIKNIGSVQGIGLLAGIELVKDKATKAPFPRSQKVIEHLIAHLFERGIIVWPNMGQADGANGDLFMIGPPLLITEAQVDELVSALAQALGEFSP